MTIEEKYINLLIQMLAIPSLSRKEETRARFLYKWLKNEGFKVDTIHNNLIVTAGNNPSAATILLNSHMDTVPPGNGWNSDPFLPLVSNGSISALGSNDAGASVVSLIASYKNLAEQGKADGIVLVISSEEEVSGANGILSVLPKLSALKFAVVGEPTGMEPAVAERGLMVVDAVASGTSGHAARDEGINAIYNAMEDIENLRNIQFQDHSRLLKDPSINVTMITSGIGHNIIPSKCDFVIDVRSNDKYSNERLLEILSGKCSASLTARSMRLKSSFLNDDHPVSKVLDDMGFKAFGSPTLSDMALMDFPSVKIGPGESARSHTANEYIKIEEISEAIDVYSKLIEKIITAEL
jgi:acetylornithine deacetylase